MWLLIEEEKTVDRRIGAVQYVQTFLEYPTFEKISFLLTTRTFYSNLFRVPSLINIRFLIYWRLKSKALNSFLNDVSYATNVLMDFYSVYLFSYISLRISISFNSETSC